MVSHPPDFFLALVLKPHGKPWVLLKHLNSMLLSVKLMKTLHLTEDKNMAGSVIGNIFRITTWGESHGEGIGAVVDGCPAGLSLCADDVQKYLERRRPGRSRFATTRREGDIVTIQSGIFQGKTTGTPISMTIANNSQRSSDYEANASYYRPGHADYTFDAKYGFRDFRGGGRSSGRETAGRVAGGAIAAKLLAELGIDVCAYTHSIGHVSIDYSRCSRENIELNPISMPDPVAAVSAEALVDELRSKGDSVGGVIECIIRGVPAGIGEPVFDKLDALLSRAIMSIGAVKGFEIGDGFLAASRKGSENNDSFYIDDGGNVRKRTNHAGGILGGMSDGSEIVFRAAIKPTPSISLTQSTINKELQNCDINVVGRHDPVIVPRAVVVVETMAASVVADLILMNMSSRLDGIKEFYKKVLK